MKTTTKSKRRTQCCGHPFAGLSQLFWADAQRVVQIRYWLLSSGILSGPYDYYGNPYSYFGPTYDRSVALRYNDAYGPRYYPRTVYGDWY